MKVEGLWRGTVSRVGGRNLLIDSVHRFPLDAVPFEGEDNELMLYLMSSSPGLFNGDSQEITCTLTEGAHLFLTDPSATELHPSVTESKSQQIQKLYLGKNSIFEYIPEPVIPFAGTNYSGITSLYMSEGSQAVVGEIVTAGRVGYGEIFQYKCFQTTFEVYWEDQLQVLDCLRLDPATDLTQKGIFNEYTHMGTLWVLSEQVTTEHLHFIQSTIIPEIASQDCYISSSLLQKNGMVIRLLGYSSEILQEVMKTTWDYFRKELFGLEGLEVLK